MKPKIYIDGQAGTTGLQIYTRIGSRTDLELLTIDPARRKDTEERRRLLNEADVVFLCLPDDAAREAAALVENDRTRIIDASTAHRTAAGWDYGFPELSASQRAAISKSRRVANPGCHATGFVSVAAPLVSAGLVKPDALLSCFSLTGYSGGGKKMIEEYEGNPPEEFASPRIYGLTQGHKHLPEMQKICGLDTAPIFCPIVDDYYKGMATTVPLHSAQLGGAGAREVREALAAHYQGAAMVRVAEEGSAPSMLPGNALRGRDILEIYVCGNEERVTVTALFDNLGKGASGAAVQNMNIMLGLEETTGLAL